MSSALNPSSRVSSAHMQISSNSHAAVILRCLSLSTQKEAAMVEQGVLGADGYPNWASPITFLHH
eukprot:1100409-Pelagomonas_calceolata.AAC.2